MKSYITGLSIALLAGSVPLASAGDISGKVTLKGTPKPEIPIDLGDICGKLHAGEKVTTGHFVVGPDQGLANVFVYIKEGAKSTPPAGESPLLDQKGCLYEPYVLGVVAGQPLKIRSSDPFMHNVHAMPKVPGNKEFNFAQAVQGQVNEKTFEKPEVLVRMKCDVHPWMFAYVGVVEHPYYAVTGKDGSFKISNVPAGNYTVEAFHLKAGAKTEKVTVGASDSKTVSFELMAPQ
jgi:Carboxypeptidase regulatory-like domain